MDKIAKLRTLAETQNGLLKFADFRAVNICFRTSKRLLQDGVLEKVKTGTYRFADDDHRANELELIEQLFPDGILCKETALFHYGYADCKPEKWDLAFDKNVSKSRFKLAFPKIRPHFLSPEHLQYGVETICIEKCLFNIFTRERVYCESLLNRGKMDKRIFEPAALRFKNDHSINMSQLMACADRRHVLYKVIKIFEIDLE